VQSVAALRLRRGIEVNSETIALDVIRKVNFRGNYLAEAHTVQHYRREHFIPRLLPREPLEAWEKAGSRTAIEHARERVKKILAEHGAAGSSPKPLDPKAKQAIQEILASAKTKD
jgi:trimethylamine--corrinoid protein Co-methyltransferase